ncbi:MAG: putative redox protein, regulator of disulfide bond formation [halophilic archaeon J07HX64]|jgi:Predicted redox protein, regulator of disulfide bond formation|nr:MAG: putative redox protein, regulator of disulfide bond formation [halophilic archaeon J07HX64]
MSEADNLERYSVSASSESNTRTLVEVREFEFVVDEPAELDGTNEGPNPVEYFIGSWAGCLNVVTHAVAAERDIDIEGIEFEIAGELDPRALLGIADDVRAGYQEIRVNMSVESEADEAELAALGEAVEQRCPVADNITNPTPTEVVFEPAGD